mgnify:FL=1
MAVFPTSADLRAAAIRKVTIGPSPFTPESARAEGGALWATIDAAATMGEEVARASQQQWNEISLPTAIKIGGAVLDRWVYNNIGEELAGRQEAQLAVVPASFTKVGGLPTDSSFPIPAGTLVATASGLTFRTIVAAIYPAGVGGKIVTVTAQCLTAGPVGNVDRGAVTKLVSTLDTVATVNVVNLEFGSGGTVDETDSEYGARAQGFYRSARRGTRFAIEEGARTTPGVTQATATELLSPYDTQPKFRGAILVADANGQANRALTERVRLNLENYRALGVPLSVKGGIPYYPNIVIEGLQFVAGANTIAVIEQVRAQIVADINLLAPGQTLERALIFAAMKRVPQVLVPAACLIEPAGDIVPQFAPALANFTIIRAALNTVLINGT